MLTARISAHNDDDRPPRSVLAKIDAHEPAREDEAMTTRLVNLPPTLPPLTTVTSPTYYPPGPPPPYNYASTNHPGPWSAKSVDEHTPPASRRTSGDDLETAKQTSKQSLPSLPSISDVLGVDRPPTLTTLSTASTTSSLVTPNSNHVSTHAPSPSPTAQSLPSLLETANLGSYRRHVTPSTSHHHDRPWSDEQPAKDASGISNSLLNNASPRHRDDHSRSQHNSHSTYSHSHTSSPFPHTSPMQSAQSQHSLMGPPPPLAYGYTPYAPRSSSTSSTFAPSASTGPIYQPSLAHASSSWHPEPTTSKTGADGRVNAAVAYGDSVKRHLDFFDLEAALNDIATSSGILMDFTRRYGDCLHQTARTGPDLNSLPGLVEVDDMITKSRMQLDALVKIRDVVVTQHAAYEQQIADQRRKKSYDEVQSIGQDGVSDHDENKTAFMNADAKKRRGRAAPPGRCHSCNRAETPEWRRGPDGARTLCNACGLHYAKLTRKQLGTNKNSNVGNSNLRPKSNLTDP